MQFLYCFVQISSIFLIFHILSLKIHFFYIFFRFLGAECLAPKPQSSWQLHPPQFSMNLHDNPPLAHRSTLNILSKPPQKPNKNSNDRKTLINMGFNSVKVDEKLAQARDLDSALELLLNDQQIEEDRMFASRLNGSDPFAVSSNHKNSFWFLFFSNCAFF